MDTRELIEKLTNFIQDIGLNIYFEAITNTTFLPGLKIKSGALIIDLDKLTYPGDILHEAGHLATMPPQIRKNMNDTLGSDDLHRGGEMMAIAWSYAACIYLMIDPAIVFHSEGYKGDGYNIFLEFSEGRHFGVPLLQWCGMTFDESNAKQQGKEPYPVMAHWTCKLRPDARS